MFRVYVGWLGAFSPMGLRVDVLRVSMVEVGLGFRD